MMITTTKTAVNFFYHQVYFYLHDADERVENKQNIGGHDVDDEINDERGGNFFYHNIYSKLNLYVRR